MTLFDLLFLLVFFATLAALITAAVFSLRGDQATAGKTVLGVAIFLGIYLAVVIGVSLATPRRYVELNERHCYDDWCVAVVHATRGSPPEAVFQVQLRVSSDAKRVQQRAPDTKVFVEDANGKRYAGWLVPGQPGFGTRIGPGESFETGFEFDVPANTQIAGVVVNHSTPGPGSFIIAEDSAIFHQPMLYKVK